MLNQMGTNSHSLVPQTTDFKYRIESFQKRMPGEKKGIRLKGLARCVGHIFIRTHALVLTVTGNAGLIIEDETDMTNVFVHVGYPPNGIYDLIK